MNIEGRTVFLLEDELIIAFAVEDVLIAQGAEVVLASSLEEAAILLDEASPSLAILDVNIKGEKSYPVATGLLRRGVPILFATGYGDAEHPPQFLCTPTLTKPYNRGELLSAIAQVV